MPAQTRIPRNAMRMPHGAIAMAKAEDRRPSRHAAALHAPGLLMHDPDLPLIDPEFDIEAETGIDFGGRDRFF